MATHAHLLTSSQRTVILLFEAFEALREGVVVGEARAVVVARFGLLGVGWLGWLRSPFWVWFFCFPLWIIWVGRRRGADGLGLDGREGGGLDRRGGGLDGGRSSRRGGQELLRGRVVVVRLGGLSGLFVAARGHPKVWGERGVCLNGRVVFGLFHEDVGHVFEFRRRRRRRRGRGRRGRDGREDDVALGVGDAYDLGDGGLLLEFAPCWRRRRHPGRRKLAVRVGQIRSRGDVDREARGPGHGLGGHGVVVEARVRGGPVDVVLVGDGREVLYDEKRRRRRDR
mmetsp:Transcript_28357/g.91447  ORF Transcript_28357/g.91447 Transcript_28357/m.91447 type:complete len:283 (+) Transcript_28357:253-1101(+)